MTCQNWSFTNWYDTFTHQQAYTPHTHIHIHTHTSTHTQPTTTWKPTTTERKNKTHMNVNQGQYQSISMHQCLLACRCKAHLRADIHACSVISHVLSLYANVNSVRNYISALIRIDIDTDRKFLLKTWSIVIGHHKWHPKNE